MVMSTGDTLSLGDVALPEQLVNVRSEWSQRALRDVKEEALSKLERDYLASVLAAEGGNLAAAARRAGVDRKNLWTMCQRRGIDPWSFKRR